MTPEQLAELHHHCFTVPRPWNAQEFKNFLTMPGCILLTAPDGFLLGRVLAGEGELLTLAIAPKQRRRGVGKALTEEFMKRAKDMQAEQLFLEVAASNHPARSLYSSLGWQDVGRRAKYYGSDMDAIVMRYQSE